MAAVLAGSGFKVTGVDIDAEKVDSVKHGRSPIYEPGLAALMASSRACLTATTDFDAAVADTETTFVVVPTPSDRKGGFSMRFVTPVMRRMGKALSRTTDYHLLVLTSTVMPGSMDGIVLPALEQSSRKKCGLDFGLCYNPEFIALGNVIEGLRSPDLILIGESDERAGNALSKIHSRVCSKMIPVERMSFLNAEVAKVAVNAFVTMKMSFANTLTEICERLPTGDVDKVTHAIGRDKRIGPTYLRGAIGYGGPCFPRDNRAFAVFAKRLGVGADLARATDRVNNRQVHRIVEMIEKRCTPSSRIGILGITYKPDTNVTEASQPLMVAEALTRRGFKVSVFDPAVSRSQIGQTSHLSVETTAEECVAKSDLIMVGTPWGAFSKIRRSSFSNKVVLDCWRLLNGNRPDDPSRYLALGRDMATGTGSQA